MTEDVREYNTIRVEHKGPLSWIILDRPEHANAFSAEMLHEFATALERLRTEGGPVIAIRGEGAGFGAGYDLKQVGKMNLDEVDPVADRARLERNIKTWMAIWDHPKPVIAAVHGYCLAGSNQLCVYADITIVTEDAKIGEPTIPIGGGYIAPLWSPLVGPKRAKEMSFVPGNTIDGKTAVEWGWANHAVPAADLIACVEGLAARIAKTPSEVLALKKVSINRAAEAQGFKAAAAGVCEIDALLHLAPSVVALKRRAAEVGLKTVIAEYRSPPTTPLRPLPVESS